MAAQDIALTEFGRGHRTTGRGAIMWLDRFYRILDLDNQGVGGSDLVLSAPEPSSREINACVCRTLRRAIDHGACAVHWFLAKDGGGDCVRLLICKPRRTGDASADNWQTDLLRGLPVDPAPEDSFVWYESPPLPDYFMRPFIAWISRLARTSPDGRRYILVRECGNVKRLYMTTTTPDQMCLFLGDDRPRTLLQRCSATEPNRA